MLGFDEVSEGRVPSWSQYPFKETKTGVLGGCCVQVRKCPQTPSLLTPRSWTSQPPELRKMSVSSHLIYDVSLQHVEAGLQLGPGHESRPSGPPPSLLLRQHCTVLPQSSEAAPQFGRLRKGAEEHFIVPESACMSLQRADTQFSPAQLLPPSLCSSPFHSCPKTTLLERSEKADPGKQVLLTLAEGSQ